MVPEEKLKIYSVLFPTTLNNIQIMPVMVRLYKTKFIESDVDIPHHSSFYMPMVAVEALLLENFMISITFKIN